MEQGYWEPSERLFRRVPVTGPGAQVPGMGSDPGSSCHSLLRPWPIRLWEAVKRFRVGAGVFEILRSNSRGFGKVRERSAEQRFFVGLRGIEQFVAKEKPQIRERKVACGISWIAGHRAREKRLRFSRISERERALAEMFEDARILRIDSFGLLPVRHRARLLADIPEKLRTGVKHRGVSRVAGDERGVGFFE